MTYRYAYAVGRYRYAHARFIGFAAAREPTALPPRMVDPVVWITARNKASAIRQFKTHKRLLIRLWREQQLVSLETTQERMAA